MRLTNNFICQEPYMVPDIREYKTRLNNVLCVSTGGLSEDDYSDPEHAGGDITEEDGGSLF